MAELTGTPELSEHEIRRLVGEIAADSPQCGSSVAGTTSARRGRRALPVGGLAYALRADALPALESLLQHADSRTREDAHRAIDAIRNQNHHCFVDRDRSGRSFWVVNEADKRPQ